MTIFHKNTMSQKTSSLCSKRMLFIATLTFSLCQEFIIQTEAAATNDKLASISIKNILSRSYNSSTPRSSVVQQHSVTNKTVVENVHINKFKIVSNFSSTANVNKSKHMDANNNINNIELSTVKNEEENTNNNNDNQKTFVSLTADCRSKANSFVQLHLHTSEPFFGWIYTRDHQVGINILHFDHNSNLIKDNNFSEKYLKEKKILCVLYKARMF